MKAKPRYQLNPKIAWVNESHDRIYMIHHETSERVFLEGTDVILWRCIWQGFPHQICENITNNQDLLILNKLDQWLETGLIVEV